MDRRDYFKKWSVAILLVVSLSLQTSAKSNISIIGDWLPLNSSQHNWSILVKAPCLPAFEAKHLEVMCRDMSQMSQLPAPLVKVQCGTIVQTTFEDQYFELACLVNNFSGYFDPARWTSIDKSGDGRVDVTGAPVPALLVEGTGNNLIEVANGQDRQFNLVIPADGYLSFEWDILGSSITSINTATTPLVLMINGESFQLPERNQEFLAPFVHQGDQISFNFLSELSTSILIKNFTFASNASGVVERQWRVQDDQNQMAYHKQLITVTRMNLSDIRFPTDLDFKINDNNQAQGLMDPELTGLPYLDQDGLDNTNEDRVYLNNTNQCDLDIQWEDQLEYTETGDLLVQRTWKIHDLCNGSHLTEQQVIFFQLKTVEPISPKILNTKQVFPGLDLDKPNSSY